MYIKSTLMPINPDQYEVIKISTTQAKWRRLIAFPSYASISQAPEHEKRTKTDPYPPIQGVGLAFQQA